MTSHATPTVAHTPANPCQICKGHQDLPRGKRIRCYGFSVEPYVYCTREEYAGQLSSDGEGRFRHYMAGPCHCGVDHKTGATNHIATPTQVKPAASKQDSYTEPPEGAQIYLYENAPSQPVARVIKYRESSGEKRFYQQRRAKDSPNGWLNGLGGSSKLPLYRLPELQAANPDRDVLVLEGEKDVDEARRLGFVATTNAGGAGKFRLYHAAYLAGRNIVVIADNDDPGKHHAEQVAQMVYPVAASVKLIACLPGLADMKGGDLSDWTAQGHTADELRQVIADTAPLTLPASHLYEDTNLTNKPVVTGVTSFNSSLRNSAWPLPLRDEAYHGLAGRIVRAVAPDSEADPVAIITHLLVMFGNAIGRCAYWRIGATSHYTNEYLLIAGKTSRARKGTAGNLVMPMLESIDEEWRKDRIRSGLASGEGLIHYVRDPKEESVQNKETGAWEKKVIDPGERDKRLLIFEQELSQIFRVANREGSTVTEQVRQAWDGHPLHSTSKQKGETVKEPHVSVIGHITVGELKKVLSETNVVNGLANRFLMVVVEQQSANPFGEQNFTNLGPLVNELRGAVSFARTVGRMDMTPAAKALWGEEHGLYEYVGRDVPDGLFAASIARAEAHIRRFACIYALLDKQPDVDVPHLLAALALWEYAERSALYLFGSATGDAVADQILSELMLSPYGLNKTEMFGLLGNNPKRDRLNTALKLLQEQGRASRAAPSLADDASAKGRPEERWISLQGEGVDYSRFFDIGHRLIREQAETGNEVADMSLASRNGAVPPNTAPDVAAFMAAQQSDSEEASW